MSNLGADETEFIFLAKGAKGITSHTGKVVRSRTFRRNQRSTRRSGGFSDRRGGLLHDKNLRLEELVVIHVVSNGEPHVVIQKEPLPDINIEPENSSERHVKFGFCTEVREVFIEEIADGRREGLLENLYKVGVRLSPVVLADG